MVDFSFIIVTYNSHLLIGDAIKSISQYEINSESYEIIIVDNSSIQSHQILLQTLDDFQISDSIKVIHNPANTGYGAGNNIGIKVANGKYIAIMNPDIRLLEPVLTSAKKNFLAHDNLLMVAFKQMGGINFSFHRKPEHSFLLSSFYMKMKNKFDIFDQKRDFLSGAFFFLDKERFFEIGLFDENIFMYNEESDISNRINQKNYKIKYLPEISYLHLLEDRPFNCDAFRAEMKTLDYYLTKYQLNKDKIINRNKLELQIKLKLAVLLNKKEYFHKFSQMNSIIVEKFSRD